MDGVIDENRPSLKPVRDLLLEGINGLRSRGRFRRQIQRPTRRRAKPNLAGFHQNRNRHCNLRCAGSSLPLLYSISQRTRSELALALQRVRILRISKSELGLHIVCTFGGQAPLRWSFLDLSGRKRNTLSDTWAVAYDDRRVEYDLWKVAVWNPRPSQAITRRKLNKMTTCRESRAAFSGGGNCTRSSFDESCFSQTVCENCPTGMSEECRDDATLRELVASWHRLTPDVRAAIMQLVRGGGWPCVSNVNPAAVSSAKPIDAGCDNYVWCPRNLSPESPTRRRLLASSERESLYMDSRQSEQIAENAIVSELLREGILIAKPFF